MERIIPQSFQKELTWPTPSFQTSGLQNGERINFYCSKAPAYADFVR